jgi:hypothetical protein
VVATVVGAVRKGVIKSSVAMRERIEEFVKNSISTLGHCLIEDPEVQDVVILSLVCVGVFWLVGVAVYDFILDPHVTTVASLDSLSINPDKWIQKI